MRTKRSGWFPDVKIDPVKRQHMRAAVKTLRTKADKIRALSAAGYSKPQVASFLGIRYQHVRNVLVRAEQNYPALRQPPRPKGFYEPPPAPMQEWQEAGPDEPPTYGSFVLDEHGRITLPRNVLAALDGEPRRSIPWRFEDGELKLMSRAAGIRFAQSMVAEMKKRHPGSWTDELIAERRAEAVREDERYERWRHR